MRAGKGVRRVGKKRWKEEEHLTLPILKQSSKRSRREGERGGGRYGGVRGAERKPRMSIKVEYSKVLYTVCSRIVYSFTVLKFYRSALIESCVLRSKRGNGDRMGGGEKRAGVFKKKNKLNKNNTMLKCQHYRAVAT